MQLDPLTPQRPRCARPAVRAQLSDGQVHEVRELIERLVSTSSMSTRPAIYGIVAERELERLTRCAGATGRARAEPSFGGPAGRCARRRWL